MNSDFQKRFDRLRVSLTEAWRVLDLDARKREIAALEVESGASDFWTDADRAKRELKKLADLKREYGDWAKMKERLANANELAEMMAAEGTSDVDQGDIEKELASIEKDFETLEFAMLLGEPHDASSAVMSIHAGAGGTDAQDWAEMLMRMYFRFAERKEWSVRLVDESRGGEAGIKSCTFFVEGRYAYGNLKTEAGVHRLVRLSPFNSDALRQTSFALVEVLPEFDETISIEIKPEDLRIDTYMSGGKGGQSVNTTYSAVRIVHLPTKIVVTCQNERSQTQNRETAMKILKAKLLKLKEEELQKEKQQMRGEYHSAEWGNQIRSYVLQPYRMVKDHRTDFETSDTDGVLDGNLEPFIEAELRLMAEKKDVSGNLNAE